MAEKFDKLSKNLKQSSTWYRIFSMLVLSLLVCVAVVPLIIVLSVSQAVLTLVSGSNNQNLRVFGMEMTEYVNQVLRYITYNSEKKPYPFSSQDKRANLGSDARFRNQAQPTLFGKGRTKDKKKLYEIETSNAQATVGKAETAKEEPAKEAPKEVETTPTRAELNQDINATKGASAKSALQDKDSQCPSLSGADSDVAKTEFAAKGRHFDEPDVSNKPGQIDKTLSRRL